MPQGTDRNDTDTNGRGGGGRNGGGSPAAAQRSGNGAPGGENGHGGTQAGGGGRNGFDLAGAALDAMREAGFRTEFGAGVAEQVGEIEAGFAAQGRESARLRAEAGGSEAGRAEAGRAEAGRAGGGLEDLRGMGWSSIDNDTSKDLDQIEVAERVEGGIRLRVAVGDVASAVAKGSAIDRHAAEQTQTIYTSVRNFPMLPPELSTGLTSLNEAEDRRAVVLCFTVGREGVMLEESVTLGEVRNRAQLAYSRVGPWMERAAAGEGAAGADLEELRSDSAREGKQIEEGTRERGPEEGWLAEQLRMQAEAATALHEARVRRGALEFHKAEVDPVVLDGRIVGVHEVVQNPAMRLIEDLMVAANGVVARALRRGGRSGLQRVVRVPVRWDRIVALAAAHGGTLPATPDPVALNRFLETQRSTDPVRSTDLAVAVIKLLGPGEYMLMRAEDDPTGHFGLAAREYTHATAPNRRFPDLVTQRVLHAMMREEPAPYSDAELAAIAQHCNEADKALRKIERAMQKRVAAVAMASRTGEVFAGVVTGASGKGVYVRVIQPPFEGRVVQGGEGLDVGDKVSVKLIHTDPARAFIDFAALRGRRPAADGGSRSLLKKEANPCGD